MQNGAKRVWKTVCIFLPGSSSLCFLTLACMAFHVILHEMKVAVDTEARGCEWEVHYTVKELSSCRNVYSLTDLVPLVYTMHEVCCWR